MNPALEYLKLILCQGSSTPSLSYPFQKAWGRVLCQNHARREWGRDLFYLSEQLPEFLNKMRLKPSTSRSISERVVKCGLQAREPYRYTLFAPYFSRSRAAARRAFARASWRREAISCSSLRARSCQARRSISIFSISIPYAQ